MHSLELTFPSLVLSPYALALVTSGSGYVGIRFSGNWINRSSLSFTVGLLYMFYRASPSSTERRAGMKANLKVCVSPGEPFASFLRKDFFVQSLRPVGWQVKYSNSPLRKLCYCLSSYRRIPTRALPERARRGLSIEEELRTCGSS